MAIKLTQAITPSDWVKIAILLVIAMVAWYQVFSLYSQPFDLTSDIQRQQQVQQHDNAALPPLITPNE